MINSFNDLSERFNIVSAVAHRVTRKSAGAVGELFEELMVGEIVGNDRGADFAAINTEAKVHHGKGQTTVFSYAPTYGVKAAQFKAAYGSSIVRSNGNNGKGHVLEVTDERVSVIVDGVAVCGWMVSELLSRITEKMPNLAIVAATKKGEQVTFDRMTVCRQIVATRFLDSIKRGEVSIEMRGSRGVSFRAMPETIIKWFETVH